MAILSKDFGCLDFYEIEFLIDVTQLSMAVSDDQKNIQVSFNWCRFVDTYWKNAA